jgi:tagatose-1,6-bisphosphate aldolase
MNVELLKAVAHEKLIILTMEKLPEDAKLALKMRLDAILSNYAKSFLLDQLYQYLRMVHALYDAKQISEEQFKKLLIDYDTIKAIFS